ncbi:MAG: iron export ABC transporter permease subunit FetB [Gammaproteobacteria bacterium]|nr:iron export ABC transporter permease subunit FetB [Gammaproteobacteria bacterium]
MNIITLGYIDLIIAALLVAVLALVSIFLQLNLGTKIVIAAVRTTIQLLLIGFVLKILFENSQISWVLLLSLVMLLIAGYEIMARQTHRFKGGWAYGIGSLSMFISSFTITLFSLIVIVQPDPWYQPQYAIPLLGMLLGNTMTGISLGINHLTQTTVQIQNTIEAKLLLGQSWKQAISDTQKHSVRVGLIPMINAMAAAGIVSIPGMMTGQILSGTAPIEAVKYQILIMFLISAGTGFGTLAAVYMSAQHLFDKRHRLRTDRLQYPNK